MAQYKVIKNFTDLQDKNHKYVAGDQYPRNGLTVSDERINELATNKNKRGTPMIEKIVDKPVELENEPEIAADPVEPVKKAAPKKGKKK